MNQILTSSILSIALLSLGCGGSQKAGPADVAVDEGPQCIDASLNLRDQVNALGTRTGVDQTEAATVAHDLVLERCPADGWSPAAIACLTTATADQMADCGELLTPAQHDAFRGALEQQPAAAAALQQLMQKAAPAEAAAPAAEAPAPTDPCGGAE